MPHEGPADENTGRDRRLEEVLSWAIDHLADQTNFAVPGVVAGDPEVLAAEGPVPSYVGDPLWRLVEMSSGRALVVGRRRGDGPCLFVIRSSDGPLTQVIIQPELQPDVSSSDVSREAVGELVLPSGRLVVGDPETVARWGPAVAPDDDLDVQAKTGWDEPSPTYLGLVVVVRLEPGAHCPLEVARTGDGQLYEVTVALPAPGWVRKNLQP